MTQKLNEAMDKKILDHMPIEKAIVKIAEAMTNRDEKIKECAHVCRLFTKQE